MTRNRKVDPLVLEHEYIYDSASPPISFTGLAERHGLARNTVAEKARLGRWYERREEFRRQLGVKTVEALGEQWVRFETATREKLMAIGLAYIERYAAALADPEFKVSTRDLLGVAAMMRTYLSDAAVAKTNGEEVLLDPETADLDPAVARRVLRVLEAGEPGAAAAAAAPGPAEPRPD